MLLCCALAAVAKRAQSRIESGNQNGEAAAWLEKYSLMEPVRAQQRLRFIEKYRSYVITYNHGLQLVGDWVEAAGNYVRLHVGAESHLLRETMNSIETRLHPDTFFRIHRSRIVNMERIQELQPWLNGEYAVLLRTGTRLTLSRGYREKLQERLGRSL